MVPLLAPLLGSLAGSLLPATLGTGIASTLGLSGAAGGLIAAAAPKAIGAGIGTLLAGGDLGEAALNAVGFGAGGALLGGAGGAAASGAGAASGGAAQTGAGLLGGGTTAAAAPLTAMGAGPAAAPAAATAPLNAAPAAAPTSVDPMAFIKKYGQATSMLQQGGGQAAPQFSPPQVAQGNQKRASENPMLTAMQGPAPAISANMPAATPTSMGIGALPMGGLPPIGAGNNMFAGMGPDRKQMVSDYLASQGMVGFA